MESAVERLTDLLNHHRQLLDCFIIDFFTESHWEKLAPSWRVAFEGCSFEEAYRFLLPLPHGFKEQGHNQTIVWPLSLLAYVAAARSLSLPRSRQDYQPCSPTAVSSDNKPQLEKHVSSGGVVVHEEAGEGECPGERLGPGKDVRPPPHLLTRHVKPKKRHELGYLSETVAALARQTGSSLVVDVGSGQGHLSRCLAFQHGLNVTSIEAVGCHQERAARYDEQVAFGLSKEVRKKTAKEPSDSLLVGSKGDPVELKCGRLQHITAVLYPNTTAEEFTRKVLSGDREDLLLYVEQAPQRDQTSFSSSPVQQEAAEQSCLHEERSCRHPHTGATASSTGPQGEDNLVFAGLHTCGDLGPTMLRVFAACPQARGLVSVGCCYMKLTTVDDQRHPAADFPSRPHPGDVPSPPPNPGDVPSPPPHPGDVPSPPPHPGDVPSPPPHPGDIPSSPSNPGDVSPPPPNPGDVPSPPPHPGDVPSPPPHPGDVPSPPPHPGDVPSPPPHPGDIPSSPSNPGDVPSPLLHPGNVPSSPSNPGDIPSTPPHPGSVSSPHHCPGETIPDPTQASHPLGYPLSQFVSSLKGHELSYRAREVSCHAMENYATRIINMTSLSASLPLVTALGDPEHLKVHCHRAVMETILIQHDMHRERVRLTPKQSKLPFKEYAKAVMKAVNLDEDIRMEELQPMLAQWWKVALFFIVRLVLAPCVESLLLLDRAIYLKETGASVVLVPLFEPTLSPRNTAIVAHKRNTEV